MNSNFIDWLKICFFSCFAIFSSILLLDVYDFLFLGKFKENEVSWMNFQIVCRLKIMQHLFLSITTSYLSLITTLQRQNFNSFSVDSYKIFSLLQEKSKNFRFPQLKAFMSKKQFLIRVIRYINYLNIVGVHINSFITDGQLFKFIFLPYNLNPCISNVQLVFPLEQKLELIWLFVIEHYKENT